MNYNKLGIPSVPSPDLQPLYNISGQINSGNAATSNLSFNTLSVNSSSIWSNNENLLISTGNSRFYNTGIFNQSIPVRSIGRVSGTGVTAGSYFTGWSNSGIGLRYFIKLDKGSPVTITISGSGRFYTPIGWLSSSSITGKLNSFNLFSGVTQTGSIRSSFPFISGNSNYRFTGTLPITDEYLFLTGNSVNSASNNMFINVSGNFGYFSGLKYVAGEVEWPGSCEYFGGLITDSETDNEVLETGANYFNLLNSIGNLNTGQVATGLIFNDPYTFRCLTKETTGAVTQILGGMNKNSTPLLSGVFGYGKSGSKMFLSSTYVDGLYFIYSSGTGTGNGNLEKYDQPIMSSTAINSNNSNEITNNTLFTVLPSNNYYAN
jgi:hypothetical protein